MKDAPQPRKSPSPIFYAILLSTAGVGLRLLLSAALTRQASRPGSLVVWVLAAAAAAAATLAVWAFLRIWKNAESWAFFLGAAILFVLLYKIGKNRPEISSFELPLAIFALTPAGLLIWGFVRHVRRADELQRKILLEALAVSFVVQFTAAVVYAFLEGLGVARPPSVLWASLLVISWSASLAVLSARYERNSAQMPQ